MKKQSIRLWVFSARVVTMLMICCWIFIIGSLSGCGHKSEIQLLNNIYKTLDVESVAKIPHGYGHQWVVRTPDGAVVLVRRKEVVQLLPKVEMGKACFDEVPEPTI